MRLRLLSAGCQGAEGEFLRGCHLLFWIGLLAVATPGCFSSKWAMDHADYRKKYDQPYSGNDFKKWNRMARQMVDARHVANDSGYYIGGAGSNFRQNPAGGAEVGVTNYALPWLSTKVALAGQVNSGAENAFVGVNTAVHLSTPTRVAPFVGAGVFGGVDIASAINTLASDNDQMDVEETNTRTQFLGAVYPEAGVHVWLNGRTRLSASASYWMTTSSHDREFWYYGLGVTFGFGPDGRTFDSDAMYREDEFVNRLLDEREQSATRNSAISLTAGLAEETDNQQEASRSDEPQERKTRAEPVEPDQSRSPLYLPPPPRSRVLSPVRSPVYVEPPTD